MMNMGLFVLQKCLRKEQEVITTAKTEVLALGLTLVTGSLAFVCSL